MQPPSWCQILHSQANELEVQWYLLRSLSVETRNRQSKMQQNEKSWNFIEDEQVLHPVRAHTSISNQWTSLTWICSLLPAVMFDIVQQASFLMLFLWLLLNRFKRQGSAWWLMIYYNTYKHKWNGSTMLVKREHIIRTLLQFLLQLKNSILFLISHKSNLYKITTYAIKQHFSLQQ